MFPDPRTAIRIVDETSLRFESIARNTTCCREVRLPPPPPPPPPHLVGDSACDLCRRLVAYTGVAMRWILASRRRVALLALGLLVPLDLGRSVFARLGYAHPTSVWQPDRGVYADLTWPPGAELGPAVPLGQRVYAQRCAVCHGPDGRGDRKSTRLNSSHPSISYA